MFNNYFSWPLSSCTIIKNCNTTPAGGDGHPIARIINEFCNTITWHPIASTDSEICNTIIVINVTIAIVKVAYNYISPTNIGDCNLWTT